MKPRKKKTLEEKISETNPEFVDVVKSLSSDELNYRLSQLTKDFEAIVDSQEADEELSGVKAEASALAAPYRDGKKSVKLKQRYIIKLLKEKGAA